MGTRICVLLLSTIGCTGFQAAPDDGGVDGGSSPFVAVQGLPEGESLLAVWGSDANNIFAVGTNGLHDDYFAGQWHRTQIAQGRDYYSVWGSSATDVYAVGKVQGTGQGIVVHFDGMSWSDEYLADTALYGVWGVDNVVLAVGAQGMLWGKKVGTTLWGKRLDAPLPANPNVAQNPDEPVLWAIGGTGIEAFAMPADLDRVFQYIGNGDYVNLDPTVDRSIIFLSMWADPATPNSYFFGTNYLGIDWLTPTMPPIDATLVTDGMYRLTEDQSQSGNDQLFIRGIWGQGSTVVFAGDNGTIFRFDGVSGDLTPVASPTTSALQGVWFASLDDIWIVGERELILHGSLAP